MQARIRKMQVNDLQDKEIEWQQREIRYYHSIWREGRGSNPQTPFDVIRVAGGPDTNYRTLTF